jgi:hypothetical protein
MQNIQETSPQKYSKRNKGSGGGAQMIELLPSKCKALRSKPNIAKKKKKKKKRKKKKWKE